MYFEIESLYKAELSSRRTVDQNPKNATKGFLIFLKFFEKTK